MGIKADDIIRLRNEGALALTKMIEEKGYEEAKKTLIKRVGMRASIAIPDNEFNTSLNNAREIIYNNMSVFVYTVLHDEFGFGKSKRLKRFKKAWDELAEAIYYTDPSGHYYVNMVDMAEEVNALLDIGINVSVVDEVESTNRNSNRMMVSLESMIGFLKQKNHMEAAKDIWEDVYGKHRAWTGESQKEAREYAKKRMREDQKYEQPNMYLYAPKVLEEMMVMFGLVLSDLYDSNSDDMAEILNTVNEMMSEVLDKGQAEMESYKKEFSEKFDIELQ